MRRLKLRSWKTAVVLGHGRCRVTVAVDDVVCRVQGRCGQGRDHDRLQGRLRRSATTSTSAERRLRSRQFATVKAKSTRRSRLPG